MQTKSQKLELLEETEIKRLACRLRKEKWEKAMVDAEYATQTLMVEAEDDLAKVQSISISLVMDERPNDQSKTKKN